MLNISLKLPYIMDTIIKLRNIYLSSCQSYLQTKYKTDEKTFTKFTAESNSSFIINYGHELFDTSSGA